MLINQTPSHPFITTNQVQLVRNKQTDRLHVFPLLPTPRQHIPLLRCADDDVALDRNQQDTAINDLRNTRQMLCRLSSQSSNQYLPQRQQ